MTRNEILAIIAGVEFTRRSRALEIPHGEIADNARRMRALDELAAECLCDAEVSLHCIARMWRECRGENPPEFVR